MELFVQCIVAVLQAVFLELLLSVDNSIVISSIANKVRVEQQHKVVNWGMVGAIAMRVALLLFVSVLLENPHIAGFCVLIGGAWLVWVGYGLVTKEVDSVEEGKTPDWVLKLTHALGLTAFTAAITEVMFTDLVFSVDNLLAAVAITQNVPGVLWGFKLSLVTCIVGVVIGVLLMMLITKRVMKLMKRYPALNRSAGVVIILLALKLLVSGVLKLTQPDAIVHLSPIADFLNSIAPSVRPYAPYLESHAADFIFSGLTLLIFLWPIVYQRYQRHNLDGENAAIIQQIRDGHLPALTGQSFSRKEAEQIHHILSKGGPVSQQYYTNVVVPRVKAEHVGHKS